MSRQDFQTLLRDAVAANPERPCLRETMREGEDLRGLRLERVDLRYSQVRCDLSFAELPPAEYLVGADFTGSRRHEHDSPVPGWTVVNGGMVRAAPVESADAVAPVLPATPQVDEWAEGSGWLAAVGNR